MKPEGLSVSTNVMFACADTKQLSQTARACETALELAIVPDAQGHFGGCSERVER